MVHRGELDRAAELIKQVEEDISSEGPSPRDDEAARARYLLARSRGDPEGAALAAVEAWQRCADHGYRPHLTWFGVDLVRASVEVGNLQRARETAEAAEDVAKAVPVACWEACAMWRRGLLTCDPEGLLAAVSRMRASPRRLYLALCLEDAALALARAGKADDARPLAFEALDLFAAMDAVTDASRLGGGLRAAGIHLGSRAATRPSTTRLGQPEHERAERRPPRRRGQDQPGGGRPAVRQPGHRAHPRVERLAKTRALLPRRARRRGRPPGPLTPRPPPAAPAPPIEQASQ